MIKAKAARSCRDHVCGPRLSSDPLPARLAGQLAEVERRAISVGVPISYVGRAPLFAEPRLLVGSNTSWVVTPANEDPTRCRGRVPVPPSELAKLRSLVQAGVEFPVVFTAHEVDHDRAVRFAHGRPEHNLQAEEAAALVGEAPPDAGIMHMSQTLGAATATVGRIARTVLPLLAGAAALPLLVGAPAMAAAGAGFDPVIFGVLTISDAPSAGEEGAWVLLAQWRW